MSNIVNKNEVEENRVIEFLTNFDIQFVSLVDHASMRAPFKIIRSENTKDITGGSGSSMLNVIQSVLVPSDVDISVIRAEQPWLSSLNMEMVDEFDYYKKYNQIDVNKFKEGSLRIERLDGGALALVGETDDVTDSALIMRSHHNISVEPASFKQLVLSEVDSMLSAVLGSLELREMPVRDKKRAISSALDAFKTYVGISLDHLGENVEVRFDDCERSLSKKSEGEIVMGDEVRQEAVSETVAAPLFNIDGDTIGKIIEERAQKAFEQYGVQIDNKLDQFIQNLKASSEERQEEVKTEVQAPEAAPAVELTEELRAEIKQLQERLAKFEAEDSELSGRSSEVEDKETIDRSQPAESNIWQGLFFRG